MGGYAIPPQTKVRLLPWMLLLAVAWTVTQRVDVPALTGAGGGAAKAVAYAKRQVGKPYRWGATGPGSFDCSGLTQAAWKAAGVTIPRTAAAQLARLPKVGKLRPGDLLVYASSGPSRRHVAIVTGAGRMVEARSRATGVTASRIRPGYLGAVRPRPPAAAAPSRAARAGIPQSYLRLYREAGAGESWSDGRRRYAAWAVLAAIGQVESDHGRSSAPGVRSGVNRHGCCAGPMQFNLRNGPPSTWDTYGKGSPYDPRHAIPAAKRLLVANGVRRDLDAALYAYNHSATYVRQVKAQARRYGRM